MITLILLACAAADGGVVDDTGCHDPPGQLVTCARVIPTGPRPKSVAFRPSSGEIWTALLGGPPSVEAYDARTGERVARIALGENGAVELAFTRDGTRAYASQMETARVYEIDAEAKTLLRTFETGSRWSKVVALSPDEKRLHVSNWLGHDVSEIDVETATLLRRLPVGRKPRGLFATPDGKALYVASFATGRLERVALETGRTTTVFAGGGAARQVVGDASGRRVLFSDMKQGVVRVLEVASGKVTRLAATDANPNTMALSPDGNVLFVSTRGENGSSYLRPGPTWGSVQVFDATTGALLDAIVGGNQPTGLAVNGDGTLLAFSDMLDDRIRIHRVPATDVLRAGGGGRAGVYRCELDKARRPGSCPGRKIK